ncbi:MAG: ABC transporter substrate-binding protein [Terriglobales bacterium]|jgi:putative tryptophan/tyrosine transport system substrate-binding protein
MRRREFITLLGGAMAFWPLAARAQQTDRVRRVGVLMGYGEADPEAEALLSEFTQGLLELGWTDGRNLRMDVRWAPGRTDLMHTFAKELVNLQPDVILADSTPVTAALKRETLTVPIVFAAVADPVGSGFVASLPRPGGNITGFGSLETGSMASKWLELLTGIAPGIKRAVMMFNPETAPYIKSYVLPSFEAAARSLRVAPFAAPVHSDAEIEMVITELAREPGGGLLGMPDNFVEIHRALIISLAARNNVPAVYQTPVIARDGGLLSYGADFRDIFHRAARYVDSILRGAKPSELPVQLPTKYLMVINLKTAMALGLTVPPSILLSADEVIE